MLTCVNCNQPIEYVGSDLAPFTHSTGHTGPCVKAYPQEMKQALLDILEQVKMNYKNALNLLSPALTIHQELKDFKAAVQELVSDVEEGKYDKEPEIHRKGAVSFK